MEIFNTWQYTALEPTFVMPTHAAASAYARTDACAVTAVVTGSPVGALRLDAGRVKGSFAGSPAWSPPIS